MSKRVSETESKTPVVAKKKKPSRDCYVVISVTHVDCYKRADTYASVVEVYRKEEDAAMMCALHNINELISNDWGDREHVSDVVKAFLKAVDETVLAAKRRIKMEREAAKGIVITVKSEEEDEEEEEDVKSVDGTESDREWVIETKLEKLSHGTLRRLYADSLSAVKNAEGEFTMRDSGTWYEFSKQQVIR